MKNHKEEEIRLGLVLYGGVSLAIYMNGGCLEFFRTVKGEGVYNLIKDLRKCDILIDIISGSSAGGINGILLANCLCNNLKFDYSKKIWVEKGDIISLLNLKREKFYSLLDSEGFYEDSYKEFFTNLFKQKYDDSTAPEGISVTKELDLFITGTNFYGNYTRYDDKANYFNVEVKNHDTLFLLKYRTGRKNNFEFDESMAASFAKLARLTSSFPGAFSPVHIPDNENEKNKIYEYLREWGALENNKPFYFSDGGVVNNKPFTSTLKAIYSRNAIKKVDRKLFYLEPDPENFENSDQNTGQSGLSETKGFKKNYSKIIQPGFVKSIFTPTFGISGYQSIQDDINAIRNRNSKLKRHLRYRDSLLKALNASKDGDIEKNLKNINFDYYKDVRCEYFYKIQLESLDRKNKNVKDNLDNLIELYKKPPSLEIVFNDLEIFDVYFKQRRIYFLIYLIYEDIYRKGDKNQAEINELRELWGKLNCVNEVYEILKFQLHDHLTKFLSAGHPDSAKEVYKEMKNSLIRKFPVNIAQINKDIELDDSFREKLVANLKKEAVNNSVESEETFFKSLEEYESQLISNKNFDYLKNIYDKFELIDSYLFPNELNSDLLEKDNLEVKRFSSKDVKTGFSSLLRFDQKILGRELAHFSAFLKKSWRMNDIMWGRLDGCALIMDCLLNESSIDELKNIKSFKEYFIRRTDKGESIYLSDKDDQELISIKNEIETAQSEEEKKNIFEELKTKLIECEQSFISREELNVIKDECSIESRDKINNLTKSAEIVTERYKDFFKNDYTKINNEMWNLGSYESFGILRKTLVALYMSFRKPDKVLKFFFICASPFLALFIFIYFVKEKLNKMFNKNKQSI
ncbi:MAG: DUF3376 domain-containing protein [bacterium]